MRQSNRRRRLIDVLTTRTGGAVYIDTQVFTAHLDIHILCFRQDSHRDRRRMYTPLALRLRNTLHAVYATLEFQDGVRILPFDGAGDFLEPTQIRLIRIRDLRLPALALCKFQVHFKKIRRKESRFLAARTRADFQDDIFPVIRILRDQHLMDFQIQRIPLLFILLQLFLRQLMEIRLRLIIQNVQRILDALERLFILPILENNLSQLRMLL